MKILLSFLCLFLLTSCMYDPFRPAALRLADELERKTEMRVIHSEFKGGNWELFITPAKLDTTKVEGYEEFIEAKRKFNNDELTVEEFMEIEAVFQENVRRAKQERFKNFLDRAWRLAFKHERESVSVYVCSVRRFRSLEGEFTMSHVLFFVLIRKEALAEYVETEVQADLDAFHKWSEANTELEVLFPPFPLWVTPNHWSEEDGQKILD